MNILLQSSKDLTPQCNCRAQNLYFSKKGRLQTCDYAACQKSPYGCYLEVACKLLSIPPPPPEIVISPIFFWSSSMAII
jgi:hypothetical protein